MRTSKSSPWSLSVFETKQKKVAFSEFSFRSSEATRRLFLFGLANCIQWFDLAANLILSLGLKRCALLVILSQCMLDVRA